MSYWVNEDPWYKSGLHLIRTYYVYLRTRFAVDHDDDAIRAIEAMIGDFPEMLSPNGDYTPFSNGFVIRYIAKQVTASGLAEEWKDHLKYFEAWAIHDGMADFVESFANGPTSVALERLKATDQNGRLLPLSQVFAVFHDAEADAETKRRYDCDQAAEFIKGSWRHTTLPAFHFENGRVLLVGTTESAVTMNRRLEVRLPRRPGSHPRNRPRFEEIVICDGTPGDGQTFFSGAPAWHHCTLYEEAA
jgi:hypothetical protein